MTNARRVILACFTALCAVVRLALQSLAQRKLLSGFGVVALCAAVLLAEQPFAFGQSQIPKPQASPSLRPPTVAGNPFSWPAGVPMPNAGGHRAAPQGSSGVQLAQNGTVSGLVVVTGAHPFAIVDGDKDPLVIGSSFAGSTIQDITALGLLLKDGRLIQADESQYATSGTVQMQQIPSIQRTVPQQPYVQVTPLTKLYQSNQKTELNTLYGQPVSTAVPPLPYHLTPPPSAQP